MCGRDTWHRATLPISHDALLQGLQARMIHIWSRGLTVGACPGCPLQDQRKNIQWAVHALLWQRGLGRPALLHLGLTRHR